MKSTLYVDGFDDRLRFRLEHSDQLAASPLQAEATQSIDSATRRTLQERADALRRRVEHETFPADARRFGDLLYRTLIPSGLRVALSEIAGPLQITTSEIGIPWELLHDGEQFWGLRYAMGRRLVTQEPFAVRSHARSRGRLRALIVGADPRGDLPFVADEIEGVCDVLSRAATVIVESGPMATFDVVTGRLQESFDIIHFCGHIVEDAAVGPALLLEDGRALGASLIAPTLAGGPVVFLNGCASARGASKASDDRWAQIVAGVAGAFLHGGAASVVGMLCDVSDRHAARLAVAFYDRLLGGASIGESLRSARGACRSLPDSAPSPVWLAPVLYGSPETALVVSDVQGARHDRSPKPLPWEEEPASTVLRGPGVHGMVARPAAPRRSRRLPALVIAAGVIAAIVAWGFSSHGALRVVLKRAETIEYGPEYGPVSEPVLNLTDATMLTIFAGLAEGSSGRVEVAVDACPRGRTCASPVVGTNAFQYVLKVASVDQGLELLGHLLGAENVVSVMRREVGAQEALVELASRIGRATFKGLGVTLEEGEEDGAVANARLVPLMVASGECVSATESAIAEVEEGTVSPPSPETRRAVEESLDALRDALESQEIARMRAMQPALTATQASNLQDYWKVARNLRVTLDGLTMRQGRKGHVLVSVVRDDRFTQEDGRPARVLAPMAVVFRPQGKRWTVVTAKAAQPAKQRKRRKKQKKLPTQTTPIEWPEMTTTTTLPTTYLFPGWAATQQWTTRVRQGTIAVRGDEDGTQSRSVTIWELRDDRGRRARFMIPIPREQPFELAWSPGSWRSYTPQLDRTSSASISGELSQKLTADVRLDLLDALMRMPSWTSTDASIESRTVESKAGRQVERLELRPMHQQGYAQAIVWLAPDGLPVAVQLHREGSADAVVDVGFAFRKVGGQLVEAETTIRRADRPTETRLSITSVAVDQDMAPSALELRRGTDSPPGVYRLVSMQENIWKPVSRTTLIGLDANTRVIAGGRSEDMLVGGPGSEELVGGPMSDAFVFATGTGSECTHPERHISEERQRARPFSTSAMGLDRIVDFEEDRDWIGLEIETFNSLQSRPGTGFAVADEFVVVQYDAHAGIGALARASGGAGPKIIYSAESGSLFYDSNGYDPGLGTGGRFATVRRPDGRIPELVASDFVLLPRDWHHGYFRPR